MVTRRELLDAMPLYITLCTLSTMLPKWHKHCNIHIHEWLFFFFFTISIKFHPHQRECVWTTWIKLCNMCVFIPLFSVMWTAFGYSTWIFMKSACAKKLHRKSITCTCTTFHVLTYWTNSLTCNVEMSMTKLPF